MATGLKNKVLSGLFWKFAERILVQAISFVISLVLARMLAPELYGTIALVLVFVNLADVLVNNGFGEACIQDKSAGEVEFSTVFYCSIIFSLALYLVLYFAAPYIALFYSDDSLTKIIRVLALQLPMSSVKSMQQAYVSKYMLFKKMFFSSLGGTLFSGLLGIILAFQNAGVWALVVQRLLNNFITMIVLFFTVSWRPRKLFDVVAAKRLVGFGWKLMATSFLSEFYSQLRSLIIGRWYSTSDLAYYNRGEQFPSLATSTINASISSVLFPALATVNNDINKLKGLTRQSMKISSFVMFPIMLGLVAVAEPMISILLTDRWLPCVPYLRLCCIYWMLQPIQTANIQAIKACGRSDLCLKLETAKKIIGLGLLCFSMFFGVYAIALSNTVFALICMIINIVPNRKLINYGFKEQIFDMLPSLVCAILMMVVVLAVHSLPINNLSILVVQVFLGIVVYVLCSYIIKNDSLIYIWKIVMSYSKKQK